MSYNRAHSEGIRYVVLNEDGDIVRWFKQLGAAVRLAQKHGGWEVKKRDIEELEKDNDA